MSVIFSDIANAGFDVSDYDESLANLTISIIPASDIYADTNYVDSASSLGLNDNQEVVLLQWTGTTSGGTENVTAYTTSDGYVTPDFSGEDSLPVYSAILPLSTNSDPNSNGCNCDTDSNPGVDEVQTDQDGTVIADGGDSVTADDDSVAPVNYANGVVDESETDLSSSGFGSPWGVTRNWTNNQQSAADVDALDPSSSYVTGDPTEDVFGNNVVENQLARTILTYDQSSNVSIGIATNGNNVFWFNQQSGGTFAPRFYDNGSLVVTSTEIDWTNESGDVTGFYGYDSSIPVTQQGQFKFFNSPQGLSTVANYSSGLLQSVSRTYTDSGSVSTTEAYVYSYSNVSDGVTTVDRVSQIQLERLVSGSTDYVQTVLYNYYDGTGYGNLGDLESATTYDGSGPTDSNSNNHNPINTDYYRYYTSFSSTGYVGGLQFVVTGANYARLVASLDGGSLADADNSTVAEFANYQYTYDYEHRISSEVVAGAGGTSAGGGTNVGQADGFGVYTYSYESSTNDAGPNSWATKTIVTQPNGTDDIVYTNAFGQVMLNIMDGTGGSEPSPSDPVRITDYQYNDNGQVVQLAQPNAFQIVDGASYNDSNADPSTGFLSTSSGLIETINYYNSSSATLSSAGGVINYEQNMTFSQGTSGTPQLQESWSYIAHNYSGGATIYAMATDTTYGLANGNDARTTSYSYNWFSGTNAISSSTATLPEITTSENGPGTSNTSSVAYNSLGMEVWSQDENGHVSYTAYNIATGAAVTQVTDVAFTESGGTWNSAYGTLYLPSGWSLSSGGLNLATTDTVDDQGRPLVETSPAGNVDKFAYDDPDHEVREYDGWVGSAPMTPTQIYREDWTSGYTETLTTTDTPDLTANTLETVSPSNVQTLSRSLLNGAGEVIKEEDYSSLGSSAWSSMSAFAGTIAFSGTGTNYYTTTFDYDLDGNLDRTVDSNGTIKRTIYDDLDEPLSTWIGVDDTPSSGAWPTNTSGTDMVEVSANAYDIDGNTIETVQYPGNNSNGSASVMYYDYRDRLIAKMTGAVETAATPTGSAFADPDGNDTFVSYYSLDNLGEVTESDTYNAEQQPISFDGVVPNGASATGGWRFIDEAGVAVAAEDGRSLTIGTNAAPDGSQVAYIAGGSIITQTVNFNAGTYTLSFDSVQRHYYNPGQTLNVLVDGSIVETVTPGSYSTFETDTTAAFTVSNGPHTITFQGTAAGVALIDNVQIFNSSGTAYAPPTLADASFETPTAFGYDDSSYGDHYQTAGPPVPTGNMKLISATSYNYDDQGNVFSEYSLAVDPTTGQDVAYDGSVSYLETNYYYDADGNLIASIDKTGAATKYTYNGADWLTATYTTDGGQLNNFSNVTIGSGGAYAAAASVSGDVVLTQTQDVYDNDGNVIETITSDRFGTDATSSTGTLGNASGGVFARVSYTASYYDAADRDIADVNVGTNGGSAWTRPSNAPTGSATVLVNTTAYNPAGWVDETTDPNGIVTKYGYDMLGRTTETIADYTGTPTSNSDQTTFYTYDGDGNVTNMTANVSGGVSQVTTYVYGINTSQGSYFDSNDMLYKVEYPDPVTGSNYNASGQPAYNQAETYTYDAWGDQTTYLDRNGTKHAYTYDLLDRLTQDEITQFGTNVSSGVAALGYAYNDQGYLSTAASYNSGGGILNQVQETYDGLGQLTSDAQSHSGNVSSGTQAVTYAYDIANDDRLTSITYPDGRTIDYNYNGASGLDTILGRITSVSDSSGTLQSYTYLGLDTPVTFNNGNGVALSYLGTAVSTGTGAGDQYAGLDRFGRIAEQNWSTSSQGVDQFAYGYDADGNVTYRDVITNTSSGTTNTNLAATSQLYSYDGLNRLTNFSTGTLSFSGSTASISSPTSTESWSLDSLGNWKSSTINNSSGVVTTNRNNSNQNQVTSVGLATLGYDANGNTTADQNGQTYTYDAWNRLISVTDANGTLLASYSYDAEGRRITETHGSATTDLYYSDRWQVVEEQQSGLTTTQHVWSPFYVDSMIETDNNPNVTTNQSSGSVDTSFGSSGVTEATYSETGDAIYGNVKTAVLSNGDILMAAVIGDFGDTTPELMWFTPSGSLDTSYGGGTGIVKETTWTNWGTIYGMVVQPNGDIDLAVQLTTGGMNVAQFSSTGTPDSSFGTGGLMTVTYGGTSLYRAYAMALLPNNDLVVGSENYSSGVTTLYMVAINLSTDSLDTSFGTSGLASVSGSTLNYLSGIAVQNDGKIVISGPYFNSSSSPTSGVFLARFNLNGTLDSTFGTSGVVEYNGGVPGSATVTAPTIEPDGKILVGDSYGLGSTVGLYVDRFNADGSPDTSFGTNGSAGVAMTVFTSITGPGAIISTPVVDAEGDILLWAVNSSTNSGTIKMIRLKPDGSLDTSFGTSGIQSGGGGYTAAGSVLDASGRLIITSYYRDGGGYLLPFLERFNTAAPAQRLYVEQDADYNVTSLTDVSGNVVERYSYDPYGNVTVLNANGTTRGDGTAASSDYNEKSLYQGMMFSVSTGTYDSRSRVYMISLGRFGQEDPEGYVDGPDQYQLELSDPVVGLDPLGLDVDKSGNEALGGGGGGGGGIGFGFGIFGGSFGGETGGAGSVSEPGIGGFNAPNEPSVPTTPGALDIPSQLKQELSPAQLAQAEKAVAQLEQQAQNFANQKAEDPLTQAIAQVNDQIHGKQSPPPPGKPPVIGTVRPYNEAEANRIPGYDDHHLDPPLGRNDPSYKTGPTIPVRNDNAGKKVPGGVNCHTGAGGFQTSLNQYIKDSGFTRDQWNALSEADRYFYLRRYYAGLGIPFEK